jgi:hypothetical protein
MARGQPSRWLAAAVVDALSCSPMSATHCLNCNAPLQGAYCHSCGQKGNTHRLTLKHFLAHDLVHGLWHLDGAFPRTVKAALLWPGRTAREYIAGRRVGHFNLVTLILILIATNIFLTRSLYPHGRADAIIKTVYKNDTLQGGKTVVTKFNTERIEKDRDNVVPLEQWLKRQLKWIILGAIPLLSLASLIVFRRAGYNYAEHLVVNAFFLAGALAVFLLGTLITRGAEMVASRVLSIRPFFALVAFFATYWQAHHRHYSTGGWLWRAVGVLVVACILFLLCVVVAAVLWALLRSEPLTFTTSG